MPPAIVSICAMVAGAVIAQSGIVIAAIGATGALVAGVVASALVAYAASSLLGLNRQADIALPSFDNVSKNILANKPSAAAAIPVVYGSRRVGGTIVNMAVTGAENEFLHIFLVLCEGPVSAINTVYLDDVASESFRYPGYVRINKHLGADDQVADADAVAELADWGDNHRLRGVAYLYVRLQYHYKAWFSIPTITADIDGRTLYDPRDASTAFSNNPVLAIRDYLTNTRYGRGIAEAAIDDTYNEDETDHCDDTVTVASQAITRYTCDGVVDTSQTSMAIVEKLLSACRGMLVFTGGKYRVVIDRERTPIAFAFTESNIVGAWNIDLGAKRDSFNRIRAQFFNPATNWQPDFATVDSAALRVLDNGLLLERQIELPFTAHAGRAAMIAAICVNQSRQMIGVRFTSTIAGTRCEVGDVVPITHSTPGWAAKNFLILGVTLKNNDEVEITAREYDATVYDHGTIAAVNTAPDTVLPDVYNVAPPTDLVVTEQLYTTREGAGVKCRLTLSWTAAADSFVVSYQVEWRLTSDTDFVVAGTTSANEFTLYDFAPGTYVFQVKSINTLGFFSEYCQHTQEIFGLDAAPSAITGLSLQVINNQVHLSWDQSVDLDVRIGGRIRVRYSAAGTPTWTSAMDIGPAVPGSATSTVLPNLNGTYFVKAVDSVGLESATATSLTTTVPNLVSLNTIVTSTQDPGFAGAKTDMVAVDNILKLDSSVLIDDLADDVDDWERWDGGGALETSGQYEFAAAVDLGAVYNSRISVGITCSCYEITDLVDTRAGNVDDFPDWDDNAFSDIDILMYVATTDDDPAGAAVWSDWRQFFVGDHTCRGYKFKLVVATGADTHQVEVSVLRVTVDMPDRVQSQRDLTVPVTGLAVTFPAAYYATPAIGVTIQNPAAGDHAVISAATATGFSVTVKDSGESAVERKIDYLSKGY